MDITPSYVAAFTFSSRNHVIELLKEHPRGMKNKELIKKSWFYSWIVRSVLKQLESEGLVKYKWFKKTKMIYYNG